MTIFIRALAGVLLTFSLFSAQAHEHQPQPAQATPVHHAQGIIKKITPQTVTIAHQAIADLNWPPMTMQFALSAPVSLTAGDRVDFTFVQDDSGYRIVSLTALH